MGWFEDNHHAGSAYDFGSGYMCQGKYAGNRGYGAPRLPRARTTGHRRRSTTSTKAQKRAERKRIRCQKERDNEDYNMTIKRQKEKIGKHNDKILWKVADTIIRLNNKSGSSLQSIKKVLHATAESDKWQNHLIVSALKSGTASGALINNRGRYKVASGGGGGGRITLILTWAQKKAEKKRIKRQIERDNEDYIINSHIKRQKEKVGKHIYTEDYNKKVAGAIIRLNDKSGSSLKSIKKVPHANANAKSRRFSSHLIVSALKSGTASGALINNGGRYKVATVGGKMGATKKPRNSKKRQQDEGNAAISLLLLNP